jgi:glycosyltransferase involved in cell wall biosynthesis
MKTKILFIERKLEAGISIEKVFRQIAKKLSKDKFDYSFQQLTYSNNAFGTLKNLLFYRKSKNDIYHVTGHVHYITLILPKEKTVLTIHDLGILNIRKGLRRFILKKLLVDFPIRKLKYITAVSETTKSEILFYAKCDENRIRVIENPLQEHFYLSKKKRFNAICPGILQIGTTKNKNLENLIKALNGIECKLTIVGKIEQEVIKLLSKYKINYSNKLNLDNDQIKNEYQDADMVTFCSTYEGFGLPIIESQAMQTPVIISNISPLREVAGGAAVLVNPNDYSDIRKGILKIINDEKFRDSLVEKGLENIKRFEPKYISGLYEKLYEEIKTSIVR